MMSQHAGTGCPKLGRQGVPNPWDDLSRAMLPMLLLQSSIYSPQFLHLLWPISNPLPKKLPSMA